MAETGPQQAVMQVAAVGIEGGAAVANAAHDHRRHVGQGQGKDQQRQQQTDGGEFLGGAHQADRRQTEAKEIGAAVAHKNPGGVEVIPQEAQAGPRQGGRQQPSSRLVQAEAHRQQTYGGDATNAGGQAIEAIKPINGIGDPHQPDHRGQQA